MELPNLQAAIDSETARRFEPTDLIGKRHGDEISFVVYGSPIAQPRQRHTPLMRNGVPVIGKGGRPVVVNYTPKNSPVQQWKSDVKNSFIIAVNGGNKIWDGALSVKVHFYLPRPANLCRKKDPDEWIYHTKKPDSENLAKSLLDALSGVCFRDDRQVAYLEIGKMFSEKDRGPRAEITIRKLEG